MDRTKIFVSAYDDTNTVVAWDDSFYFSFPFSHLFSFFLFLIFPFSVQFFSGTSRLHCILLFLY